MRFELYVALRYLKAKRRQAVVGVVTTISIAGVAAGVAALVIALAITNGMRRDLQDRLLGSSAHVQLMKVKGDGIRDWQPLIERLRKVPHVTRPRRGSTSRCWWRAAHAMVARCSKGFFPPTRGRSATCCRRRRRARRAHWNRSRSRLPL